MSVSIQDQFTLSVSAEDIELFTQRVPGVPGIPNASSSDAVQEVSRTIPSTAQDHPLLSIYYSMRDFPNVIGYVQWSGPSGIENVFVKRFNDCMNCPSRPFIELEFLRDQMHGLMVPQRKNTPERTAFMQHGNQQVLISHVIQFTDWFNGLLLEIVPLREFWEKGLIHLQSAARCIDILRMCLPYSKPDGEIFLLRFSSIDRRLPSKLSFSSISKNGVDFKGDIHYNPVTLQWGIEQINDTLFEKPSVKELLLDMKKYTSMVRMYELNKYAVDDKTTILKTCL